MTDDRAIFRELSLAQRKSMLFFPFFAAFPARGLGWAVSADPVGLENRVTAQGDSEPDRWNGSPSKPIRACDLWLYIRFDGELPPAVSALHDRLCRSPCHACPFEESTAADISTQRELANGTGVAARDPGVFSF
jgi:hypothetical protein